MLNELWTFAFAWYNLPFTFLLGLCLLLAAFQLVGLGVDHEAEADFDGDVDVDTAVDTEVEADADGDTDADHAADHDGDVHSPLALLAYVGLGKAPLMVVLLLLFSSIGLLGWGLNGIVGGLGFWANLLVMPAAFAGGVVVSARLSRWLGRALPPVTTTATRAHELVGRRGRVTSPLVDQRYGQVHVRTPDGTLIQIFAVTDSPVPIRRGDEVLLVAYDSPARRYWVTPAADTLAEPAREH
jgi:membrane protein implicated in regulation of membrane protease activity